MQLGMQPARHAVFFRRQMEFPYFSRHALANIFETREERVLDRFFAEKWMGVNWEAPSIGRKERLYSGNSMPYDTRLELVSGLTSLLEESMGPLLVAVSVDIESFCELSPDAETDVLQASLYRASQFQYVTAAARGLSLTDDDAIVAVSNGFGISSSILYGIRDVLDVPKHGSFLEMEENLRLLALLHHYLSKPQDIPLFPEFPTTTTPVN